MQTERYQTLEIFEQLQGYQEWEPFLSKLLAESSHVDFSNDNTNNNHLFTSFFEECMNMLKQYRATITTQEEEVQSLKEEVIALREENGYAGESNQNLHRQINDLEKLLNESDNLISSLREEISTKNHENDTLYLVVERLESENKDLASKKTNQQDSSFQDNSMNLTDEQTTLIEKLTKENKKQNADIETLCKQVDELQSFKEKYDELVINAQDYEALEKQNQKLQEDIATLAEEYRGLLHKAPNNYYDRLKYWETLDEMGRKSNSNLENELEGFKEEDSQNKNSMSRQNYSTKTPNKESTKKLVIDTDLMNSVEVVRASLSGSRKNMNSSGKGLKVLNLNSVFQGENSNNKKASGREIESVETRIESNSKNHHGGVHGNEAERKRSENEKKMEDNLRVTETSMEKNADGNVGDFCFDEMMSWDEEDFPKLGSVSLNETPKMGEPKRKKSLFSKGKKSEIASVKKENLLDQVLDEENNGEQEKRVARQIKLNHSGDKENRNSKNELQEKNITPKSVESKSIGTVEILYTEQSTQTNIERSPVKTIEKTIERTPEKKVEAQEVVQKAQQVAKKWRKNTKLATLVAFLAPILTSFTLILLIFALKGIKSQC